MTRLAAQQDYTSPLEERHIDFLLEEEFTVNTSFLTFFVKLAWQSQIDARFELPPEVVLPECFRSVTTTAGESDVLVLYLNQHGKKIALLIEDKIGASFQKDQAARYHERGLKGIEEGRWLHYWTCLVAPMRYASNGQRFDARVNIEDLVSFFEKNEQDRRSSFRAKILKDLAPKSHVPAVKNENVTMTELRHRYAGSATLFLGNTGWRAESKEKSYTQDSWFRFFHPALGKGMQCVHKPLVGAVQLIFARAAEETLKNLLGASARDEQLELRLIGNTGVAIEFPVSKLRSYNELLTADTGSLVQEVAHALGVLAEFLTINEQVLRPFGLLAGPIDLLNDGKTKQQYSNLEALEAQLFGFMWARARQFGGSAGFAYPHLSDLSTGSVDSKYIPISGMSGGFSIVLRYLDNGEPIIFAESESRIHGGGMLHELTFGGMWSEADSVYEPRTFREWIDQRLHKRSNS